MKWIVACVLVLATTVAGAAPDNSPARWPAKRKAPTEAWPTKVITLFVEGIVADKAGNIELALRSYDKANSEAPQANTHYNLADIYRRLGQYRRALDRYRKYLELAPDAPDRAEVQRLIATIEKTPGTVVIDGDDLDALVYVDGELVGPSPVALSLPDGKHAADRISPTTYRQRTFQTSGASFEHVRIPVEIPTPGNVVLSASAELGTIGSWSDKETGIRYDMPGRMQLAPGRYATVPWGDRTCTKVEFTVPKGDGLTFVYVDVGKRERPGGCFPIKRVRQQKVRFR